MAAHDRGGQSTMGERAHVRLGFVRLRKPERERLRQVIERLAADEDQGD
jgi:hypothetical protein